MSFDLGTCVVRVETSNGTCLAGTGFIVAPGLAVTCAHVVTTTGVVPGMNLQLVFYNGGSLEAKVLKNDWHPEQDVAFLHFDAPLPQGVIPAILGPSKNSSGHQYITLGYPEDGVVQARWPQGNIGGSVSIDNWSFALLQLQGAEIDQGLSGAPILDLDADRVIGMMTGIKDLEDRKAPAPRVRYAYAIPAEVICSLSRGNRRFTNERHSDADSQKQPLVLDRHAANNVTIIDTQGGDFAGGSIDKRSGGYYFEYPAKSGLFERLVNLFARYFLRR